MDPRSPDLTGPAEEFNDPSLTGPGKGFNDPGRHRLIQQLHDLLDQRPVSVEAWALLWLADEERLSHLIGTFESSKAQNLAFLQESHLASDVVGPWLNKRGSSSVASSSQSSALVSPVRTPTKRPRTCEEQEYPSASIQMLPPLSTPGQPVEPKPTRDKSLLSKAFSRDKRCIITKVGRYVEAAHIYSFSMSKHSDLRSQLWQFLKVFWADSKVMAWHNMIQTNLKTEFLANLVTMKKDVHAAWDNCEFALKPIPPSDGEDPDPNSMRVEFHWLKVHPRVAPMVSLLAVPDFPTHQSCGRDNLKLWDCITEKKVCSGEVIVLTTDDPKNFPLPSQELLWMQWHLNRVGALCGGAEAVDTKIDDDSDGEDSDGFPVGQNSESTSVGSSVSGITDDSHFSGTLVDAKSVPSENTQGASPLVLDSAS